MSVTVTVHRQQKLQHLQLYNIPGRRSPRVFFVWESLCCVTSLRLREHRHHGYVRHTAPTRECIHDERCSGSSISTGNRVVGTPESLENAWVWSMRLLHVHDGLTRTSSRSTLETKSMYETVCRVDRSRSRFRHSVHHRHLPWRAGCV